MKKLGLRLMVMTFYLMFIGNLVASAAPQYKGSDLDVFAVKLPLSDLNQKSGYLLRTTGKWIIPPTFDSASKFTDNGLARVSMVEMVKNFPTSKYGYIDLQGNIIIKPQFIAGHDFSEGLAAVTVDVGATKGVPTYINSAGKQMLDLREICNKMSGFTYFNDFHDGMAEVRGMATHGFVNKMGKLVGEPKFLGWGTFSDHVAVVQERLEDGTIRWGVIDQSGAYVIDPQYAFLKKFTEDAAAMQSEKDGKWGFIDKKGQMLIEPQYSEVGFFRNGLAPVMENDKWGFIDKKGKMIIGFQFDTVEAFQGTIAKAQLNHKYGWIDMTGKWVIQPLYSSSATYYPEQKIIVDCYYYDSSGRKLNHYANHMTDANEYMKKCNYKDAEVAFKAALKINPQDEAALWGLRLAKDSQK